MKIRRTRQRIADIDFARAPNSNRKHILVYQINIALIVTMLLLFAMNVVNRHVDQTSISFGSTRLLIVALISFINLVLHHLNYYRIAKLSLTFLPVFALFVLPTLIGFVEVQSYFYYPYGIMGLSLFPVMILDLNKEMRTYYVASGYYLLLIISSDILLTRFSPEPLEIANLIQDFYLYYKVVPLVIFILMQLSILHLRNQNITFEGKLLNRNKKIDMQRKELEERNEEIQQQRDAIQDQKELILAQQKDLMDSISFAERIQESVLPDKKDLKEHLPEHFIIYKPRDIVSGDFYWYGVKDNKILIAVADCTGHGIPGAFMSMLGISMIEEIFKARSNESTDHLMNELRELVVKTLKLKKDGHKVNIGMDMGLLCIDPITRTLTYTGANQSLYYVNNSELSIIKGNSMSVGLNYMVNDSFTAHQLPFHEGDVVYMLSDGYPDQFGGPKDKKFGYKRLKEAFIEFHNQSMDQQKLAFSQRYEDWRGDAAQVDDIVLMGIRL